MTESHGKTKLVVPKMEPMAPGKEKENQREEQEKDEKRGTRRGESENGKRRRRRRREWGRKRRGTARSASNLTHTLSR